MKTIGVINNWRDEELENLLKNIKIESSDVAPLGLSNKNRSEYLPVSREDSTKPESESSQLDSINESNLLSRISENWLSSRTLFPEVEKLYGHPFEIYSLAIHPSAKFLVATCKSLQKESSQLKFWRTIDWRPFQPLPLIERMIHTSTITCVQFSKKGHWLVATSRDRSFTLYKVNFTDDDSVILQLVWHQKAAHSRIIWTVDFVNLHCQDGECPLFVTGGRDNKLKMWQYFSDRGQGNLIHSLDFESSITALITLPSPPHSEKAAVCIGFESGHLCRVNISSNSATTSQGLHSNSQTSCCTSDEKRIFEEPQKIADYLCPSGSVLYLAAAVRQEGVLLAVASEDFSLRVISF